MAEEHFFLKVGECTWVNPFPGNIAFANITKDFDDNEILDVQMVGGERLCWRTHTVEAKVFIKWLDDQSVDLEQKYKEKAGEIATISVDEVSYPVKMLNVARNALSRIVRVDYGEEAQSIAQNAITAMKSIEKEWADFTTPKS